LTKDVEKDGEVSQREEEEIQVVEWEAEVWCWGISGTVFA
jgi:hypothetical protein